jgi:predicted dehydrogenase
VSAVATKPRLGFLGVGWIGRSRLERIERSGLAMVAAIADPAERDALDSLEELLERELDGVVIATPSALHAEQAIAALERGFAVFCQKPLGRTAAETARVVRAARAADRLLGVDLSYRSVEAARRVRELVRDGALGDVRAVDLVFHNAYGPDKAWCYDRDLSGGGCLIDLGIHLVDLALWTLDWPRVTAVTAALRGEPVEDYATAQLELGGGVVMRLACSWGLHAGQDAVIEASFYGTDGGASLRNVGGSFYDFVAERHRGRERERLVAPPDDWFGRAAEEWARRLAGGERYDPEVERVVDVAAALDAIYRSARCEC